LRLVCVFYFAQSAIRDGLRARAEAIVIGAVTNFFDTLGISSFATKLEWYKFRRLVPDRLTPATMLVGHTPPSMAQAIVFLLLLGVLVDSFLLLGCAATPESDTSRSPRSISALPSG
jgi:hypothetical protein